MDKVRPINANTLVKRLYAGVMAGFPNRIAKEIEGIIDSEPTIGTERVVAKWKEYPCVAECTNCRHWISLKDMQWYKFCPHCGSEIKKDDKEDNVNA